VGCLVGSFSPLALTPSHFVDTLEEKINDWTGGSRFSRILLSTIFFSFVFGPRKISDREKEEKLRQARRDKGKGVEARATERVIEGE